MNDQPLHPVTGRPIRPALELLRTWDRQQKLRQVRGVPALSNEDRIRLATSDLGTPSQTPAPPAELSSEDLGALKELGTHDELLASWVSLQLGQRDETQLDRIQQLLTSQKMEIVSPVTFPEDAEHPAYFSGVSALITRLIALTLADCSDERAGQIARWSRTHAHIYDWSNLMGKLGFAPELIAVISGHRAACELSRNAAAREDRPPRFDRLMRLNELRFQVAGLALQQTMRPAKLPAPESAINPTAAPFGPAAEVLQALLTGGRPVEIPGEISHLSLSTGAEHVELCLRTQALPFPEPATWHQMDWAEQTSLRKALLLIACTPQSLRYVQSPTATTRKTPKPPKWFRPGTETLTLLLEVLNRPTLKWQREMIKRALRTGLNLTDEREETRHIHATLQAPRPSGQP